MDMVFRKVVVVSVIVNMSILKSPIINVGFFVLDSLCSIVCIYTYYSIIYLYIYLHKIKKYII